MPQRPTFRPAQGSIPTEPGVYRFRDASGRVIYVGKAKSLRSRLNSYFGDVNGLHPRTATMVTTAASVDWVVVGNEVEALQLEYEWIKEYDPRFNVRFRDDKTYPFLAVSIGDEFPRVQVMRGAKRKGVKYFGPYTHVWSMRDTLDQLLKVFPMRSCSAGVLRRAQSSGRPCLLGYIERCSAPCVGRVTPGEHRALAEELMAFLDGRSTELIDRLRAQMGEAAAVQDYERAARLRDNLHSLERVLEKSAVVLPDGTDADVIGMWADELEAAAFIFHVRDGRIRGQRGLVVDRVEDLDEGELLEHLLQQLYGAESADPISVVPREILVSVEPPADVGAWLRLQRGANVSVRVPQRGQKRELMATVVRNAEQTLAVHKTKRATDLTARSVALQEIQDAIGLDDAPLRIECIDVSHLAGENIVASLVVFEDGLAKKSDYTRFSIRTEGADDTRAVAEVVRRRFTAPKPEHESERPSRFSYEPNLLVVDGGAPQVNAAYRVVQELGIQLPVVGLAKRLEEVWLPDDSDPIILPRSSEGLYLLQRIRDEAHRFAISYQRAKRGKSALHSALDDVPGLGEVRRKALLKAFSSVKAIRAATVEDLTTVPGIGPALAQSIKSAISDGAS